MTDKTVPDLGGVDDITSAYLDEVADKHGVPRDLLQLACERSYGTPLEEHDDIPEMARALAAVLPAARRMWAAELFGTPEEIAARKAEPLRRDDPTDLCERIAPGRHAAKVRQQTIRDLQAGKVPLAEIAAAQGIAAPQNIDDLHAGIDLTDEETEGFIAAIAECRTDDRAEIEQQVRAKVAEEIEAAGKTIDREPHCIMPGLWKQWRAAAKVARGDQCTCGDPDDPAIPRGPIGTCPVHDPEVYERALVASAKLRERAERVRQRAYHWASGAIADDGDDEREAEEVLADCGRTILWLLSPAGGSEKKEDPGEEASDGNL